MPQKISPGAAPVSSANDNGPLSPGQVKVLKWAIAIMGVLIIAALLAIFARVIYLSGTSPKNQAAPSVRSAPVSGEQFVPAASMALPEGAEIRSVDLKGGKLIVHFRKAGESGVHILDMASGETVSRIMIGSEPQR